MTTLYAYPDAAKFGRVLPKSKIYEHASPGSALKALFVRQVDQIVWQYKLAPETINVKATRNVPEIQVFLIVLKTGELKNEVLRCIDNVIPFPILFELVYENRLRCIASYKRPGDAEAGTWVQSEYVSSAWLPRDTTRTIIPVVFDLERLYTELLLPLMPFPARADENLRDHVGRMERIQGLQKELEQCESRLGKEKQFNRKVAINGEIRELRQRVLGLSV